MTPPKPALVSDTEVYELTKKGEAELRGADTGLPRAALEILVRLDGKSTVAQLAAGMPHLATTQVHQVLGSLLVSGLISEVPDSETGVLDFGGFSGLTEPLAPAAGDLREATNEAAAGVTSLEQQGYYVRIARRPANRRKLPTHRKPLAVVIEDEPQLAAFLKHFMSFQGFDTRIAGNRNEVVQALREPPRPDLILLDVMLPDTDGFEILSRIRQHPALSAVPVIMLTAKTTRDSVIKGLAGGADGYITKPFQADVLVKTIQTLFGIEPGPEQDVWDTHGAR